VTPVLWVVLLTTINHLCFSGTRFAATLFAIHLDASPAMVGVVGSSFALMAMLTSVAVGRMADRYGTRLPIVIGSAIMVAAGLLAVVWHHLAALVIAGALLGGFYNAAYICSVQALNRMGTPEQTRNTIVQLSLSFGVSSFLGPVLAGFSIDAIGHAVTLLALALLPLASVVAFGLNRVRLPAANPARTIDARPRGNALQLLRDPALMRTYIVLTALGAAWDVFNVLMPVYGSRLGFSASQIGILFGTLTAGIFLVRIVLPSLYRLVTGWQLLLLSLSVAGLCYLGLPVANSMAGLLPLVLLLGAALGAQLPVSIALLFETAPKDRAAEAFGLRVTLVTASQTSLPLVAGVLGTAVGLAPVFVAAALGLLATAWGTRSQWHKGQRSARHEPPGGAH